MTIQQSVSPPFKENAHVVIKTNENYEVQNADDVIDVFGGQDVVIKLAKNPVPGRRHAVIAGFADVVVDGNGHTVMNDLTIVPQGSFVDYIFSSINDGEWVASCCAECGPCQDNDD